MSLMGIWVGTPNYTEPTGSGTSPGLMYPSYWGQCQIAVSVCLPPPARSFCGVRHTIWPRGPTVLGPLQRLCHKAVLWPEQW